VVNSFGKGVIGEEVKESQRPPFSLFPFYPPFFWPSSCCLSPT
jgi:hypothetical protein